MILNLKKTSPVTTEAWKELSKHRNRLTNTSLHTLLQEEQREDWAFVEADNYLFDISKNLLDKPAFDALVSLAKEMDLEGWRDAFYRGEKINETEGRSVLHTALRDASRAKSTDNNPIEGLEDIEKVLSAIEEFSNQLRSGDWKGHTGKRITTVVNIGIGGSDLGPRMVYEALKSQEAQPLEVLYVANVDGVDIARTLDHCDQETTLFIVCSKTFTTQETLTNANTAKDWFLSKGGNQESIAKHFAAVSTNIPACGEFGIPPQNIFGFWNWVGGRFSVWSAVGTSLAVGLGMPAFREFLKGAAAMDEHFYSAPLEKNLPVIQGLLGVWYRNFWNTSSQAIIPYDERLNLFVDFLQQLEMESNGKSIDRNGNPVDYATCPVIWGSSGTNGQHAYFQALHQGTDIIPVDLISAVNPETNVGDHHIKLMANYMAQSRALALGKSKEQVEAELQNLSEEDRNALTPFKIFDGNRPTTQLFFTKIDSFAMGQLIALYEHKVFVQGVLWNVFSFDQWGVELGKAMAKDLIPLLEKSGDAGAMDASTQRMLSFFHAKKS